MKQMKTVGIIGGVGPETTAKFYLEIIFRTFEKNKVARPPILMWSLPLKYEIEREMLLTQTGEERYLPFLIDAAKRLEKGGVDFLVLPSNTLHLFIHQIRKSVTIPVISLIEEVARFLEGKKIKRVGILTTTTAVKNNLYQEILKNKKIKTLFTDRNDQKLINQIINRLVLNQVSNNDREKLIEIAEKFGDFGAKTVLLACTDLQLLVPKSKKMKIVDTMKIYAQAVVNKILER